MQIYSSRGLLKPVDWYLDFKLQAYMIPFFTIRAVVILFKDLLIRTLRPQAYSLCMTQAENFGIFPIFIMAAATV